MPRVDSKYQVIVTALRDQLATGRLAVGERVPSENQLALQYGVSRPTAARALNDLETEGVLERRAGSGTYVRGPGVARGVAGSMSTRTFGLLAHGLGATEVLDPICTEITRVCQAAGDEVLWGDAGPQRDAAEEVDRLCRYYLDRQVDGVFFAPLEAAADREAHNVRIADQLSKAGIHVLLLDRDVVEFPARSRYDLVGVDNVGAGLRLGAHLLAVGRTRLCFLARPHHPATTDLRAAGCRLALQRAGVEPSGRWQYSGDPGDERFVRAMLDDGPDAVVCANDATAAALMQTLTKLTESVPDDVAVVGFDDVRFATLLPVQLTTMRQPCAAIARVAVETLRARVTDPQREPRQVLLDTELVVRQSCGAVGDSLS